VTNRTRISDGIQTYERTFSGDEVFLAQHRSGGTGILPASVQLELAVVGLAGRTSFAPVELTDVSFVRPVRVPAGTSGTVELSVSPGRFELAVGGRAVSAGSGRLLPAGTPRPAATAIGPVRGDPLPVAEVYAAWAANGLEYGPAFRTVTDLTVADGDAEATVRSNDDARWFAHPLLLDAVLQVAGVALQDAGPGRPAHPMLPIGIARLVLHARLARRATVRVRRTAVEGAFSVADAVVLDDAQRVVAELTGIRMRRAPGARTSEVISRISWTPAQAATTEQAEGTWVVLHDGAPAATASVRGLREAGTRVVEVLRTAPDGPAGEHRVLATPDTAAFDALWAELTAEGAPPLAGVVHAWSCGAERAEADELDAGLHAALAALTTLAARRRSGVRFVVATGSAQAVVAGDRPVPARAALWGLWRTAAIEYPGLSPRLVDLDAASPHALLAELGAGPVEVAYREGVRHGTVREPVVEPVTSGHPVRAGGHYLVLGGHGGLGLAVAERFAEAGAGSIALVSRSGGTNADPAAVAAITRHGCAVDHVAADVHTPGGLREVVARIRRERGALHGVVHATGTLKDGLLRTATRADVDAVLGPKVDGVRELAAAVDGLELDFALLFGSVSGTFGNLGQGGYAAANAYLDAVAHAAGAPWTTIDWGLWGEVGMGVAVAEQLRRRGVRPLGTAEALDAMIAVLRSGERQLVVAHPDVAPGSAKPAPVAAAAPEGADTEERVRAALTAFLAARLDLATILSDAPMADFGIDSIMSVELAEELTRRWGTPLPATLFLEYADVDELTEALVHRYAAGPAAAPAPEPEVAPAPEASPSGAVAIVAVSGDLPGAADLDSFWAMLRDGRDAFTDVPADRWDVGAIYGDRAAGMAGTYCRSGAFVDEIDRLDPRFFGLSVREVDDMDPQQKLLLEHSWSVLQEAGAAGRRDLGVYVGATYTHHRDAAGLDAVGPHTALGSMNAVLANRISYTLDLTGPSQTVDTLCSSSLVALAQAVAALRSGQCGAAVVAACHVGLTPWYYRSLSQLGALSDGRPRPFDARADGFVPGEGAVAVLLKPLADAERDGDRIWGVVRGVAVNHGGRGSALPVPRSGSQAAVVRAALADAGLAPADISLVETHGTATRLGDPIEVAALTEVFGNDPDRRAPIALGSVKANIGHLEPASGLAGLLKVLLCLRHGEIPGLAGYEQPSEHVDLSSGTFRIPTEVAAWPADGPRRAGISAFGMGGTNAHVVVEEHVGDRSHPVGTDEAEHVLLLSAHTAEALARRVADVAALVESGTVDAGALCASASTGRQHLAMRVAVLGRDAAELAAGLRRVAHSPVGLVVRGGEVLTEAKDEPASRAFRYAAGERADRVVAALRAAGPRVVLPPYPFRAPRRAAGLVDPGTAAAQERLVAAHRILGRETVPAAVLITLGLAGAPEPVLDDVRFTARGVGRTAVTSDVAGRATGQTATFRHSDRVIGHLTLGGPAPSAPPAVAVDALAAAHPRELDPAGLHAWFATKGMEYAGPLRSVTAVRYGPDGVVARIAPDGDRFTRTVAAVDAALQSMAVLTLVDPTAPGSTLLPVAVQRVVAHADPAAAALVHLRADPLDGDGTRPARMALLDDDGRVLLTLDGVRFRAVPDVAVDAAPPTPVHAPAPPVPARAVAEPVVVELVRTVLRDPSITATSALAAAGMDSMLATLVAAEISTTLDAAVSPVDVLDARDCRALTTAVAGLLRAPRPAATAPAEPQHTAPPQTAPQPNVPASTGTPPTGTPPTAAEATPAGPGATGPIGAAPTLPTAPRRETVAVPDDRDRSRDVAVIGLSCALPGAADSHGLWSLLHAGGSGVGPAPEFRWEGGPSAPPMGGFLSDIDEFDARFFGFFPKQAEVLDPQARWLLRTAWEALESAGIAPTAAPRRTGVFVGASYQHYREYNIERELDAASGLGNHNAFLANRISWFLDLHGPSMTIDTLCSSSLVALHTAVRSLRDGECEAAIVAGVRLAVSPLHYTAMRNLRALSPTGSSKAFDNDADGFVPGEGVITLILKPLRAAQADGDRIHGVVRGTAVNHGGRTNGLTVPHSAAQQEVITDALADAGVHPDTIGMLEAHGTGTSLGDPVEIEGLTRAWRHHTDRTQFCAIGSLKTNIGHLEPAAGLAGLAKILLSLHHETIPPTLHIGRPNDHIRFEQTPFYPATGPVRWVRNGTPRRAAVSAFGMGGVNAHVIVEEAPARDPRPAIGPRDHVLRVSAATEEGVRALALAYAVRLAGSADDTETADLVHTANVGRAELTFQTAVRGHGADELAAALRTVADGLVPVARTDDDGADTPVEQDAATVVAAVRRGVTGIDWAALSAPGARTADLPTHPFVRDRHWTRESAVVLAPAAALAATTATAITTPVAVATAPAAALPTVTALPALTALSAVTPLPTVEPPAETGAVIGTPVLTTPVTVASRAAAVRTVWEPATDPVPTGTDQPVRVVAGSPIAAEAVTAALRAAGITVLPGDATAPGSGLVAVPDLDHPDTDGPTTAEFWTRLRELGGLAPGAPVLWAEHRAVAVTDGERAALRPSAAARLGAVRAAGAEAKLSVTTVDLHPADPPARRAAQVAAELRSAGDGAVAYRGGRRLQPRTRALGAGPERPHVPDGSGFYLVTGGLGAVGRELVAELAASGAGAVGIIGRSAVSELPALLPAGTATDVGYLPADATDAASLDAAIDRFGERWGRLRGVVHCSGGVNPFGAVRRRSADDAERVLAPKVAGSENVVRLARARGADFAVLVSSIAGVLPAAGCGVVDYAMANAHQLALAEREHGAAMAVTAHAWPNWTGTGMAADATFAAEHSLSPAKARRAFIAHLVTGGAVILPGGPARLAPAAAPEPQHVPATDGDIDGQVRAAFLDVLGEDPGDAEMARLGLDSVTIAELTAAVERRTGHSTDPSVLMRARTVADLVSTLAGPGTAVPTPRPAADLAPAGPTGSLGVLLMSLIDDDLVDAAPRADGGR